MRTLLQALMTGPELTRSAPTTGSPCPSPVTGPGCCCSHWSTRWEALPSVMPCLALLLTVPRCQLQRTPVSERVNLEQSSNEPTIGWLAHLHAKVREPACLEAFLRGWEWRARERGEARAGRSRCHMDCVEDCAELSPRDLLGHTW